MNASQWESLEKYCTEPETRAWVMQELQVSPIPPDQTADDWLLARSKVAEGMSEPDAWEFAWQHSQHDAADDGGGESSTAGAIAVPTSVSETRNGGLYPFDSPHDAFASPVPSRQQYSHPVPAPQIPSQLQPHSEPQRQQAQAQAQAQALYGGQDVPMYDRGLYKEHDPYGYAAPGHAQPINQQTHPHPPYGFVSLQDIAPLPRPQSQSQLHTPAPPQPVASIDPSIFSPSHPIVPLPRYYHDTADAETDELKEDVKPFISQQQQQSWAIQQPVQNPFPPSTSAPAQHTQTQAASASYSTQAYPTPADLTQKVESASPQLDIVPLSLPASGPFQPRPAAREITPFTIRHPGSTLSTTSIPCSSSATPTPIPSSGEAGAQPSRLVTKRSASPTQLIGSVKAAPPVSKKAKFSSSSLDVPLSAAGSLKKVGPASNGIEKGKPVNDRLPTSNKAGTAVRSTSQGPSATATATASASAAASSPAAGVSNPAPPAQQPMTMTAIRPLLTFERLSERKPVQLFKYLREREGKAGPMDPLFIPRPRELREIALALNRASRDYLRKMADDERYTVVWQKWLKAFLRDVRLWEPAIAPVLQVLAKTDVPVDLIIEYRLGKIAKKVADLANEKNLQSKAEIQAAFAKYNTYLVKELLPEGRRSDDADDEPAKNVTASSAGTGGPAKSAPKPSGPAGNASSGASGSSTAKGPGAKSSADMSFFGASSSAASTTAGASSSTSTGTVPKRLPSFKKNDSSAPSAPPAPLAIPPSHAPPANVGPLAGLLAKTMQNLRNQSNLSPDISTDSNTKNKNEERTVRTLKSGRKVGTIRFKDSVDAAAGGGDLEEVRLFKEEEWEAEMPFWKIGEDDHVHGHTKRELDLEEGAALAALRGHAVIDWYEPTLYIEAPPPISTPESEAQTARERGELSIAYPPNMPVPDPTEVGVKVVEADGSTVYKEREEGAQAQAQAQNPASVYAASASGVGGAAPGGSLPVPLSNDVSELLRNLGSLPGLASVPQQPQGYQPYASHAYAQNPYAQQQTYGQPSGIGSGIGENTWTRPTIATTAGYQDSYGAAPTQSQTLNNHDRAPWGGPNNYARNYDEHRLTGQGGQGGRRAGGGGGNYRSRTCKFWQQGNCRQGNECTFLHE